MNESVTSIGLKNNQVRKLSFLMGGRLAGDYAEGARGTQVWGRVFSYIVRAERGLLTVLNRAPRDGGEGH